MFKTHGGLRPDDHQLVDALSILPEDKKSIIDTSGGLRNFLLMSPSFKTQGEFVCLFEDAPVIAASMKTKTPSLAELDLSLFFGERSDIHCNESRGIKTPTPETGSSSNAVSSSSNSSQDSPIVSSPVVVPKTKSRPSSAGSNSSNGNHHVTKSAPLSNGHVNGLKESEKQSVLADDKLKVIEPIVIESVKKEKSFQEEFLEKMNGFGCPPCGDKPLQNGDFDYATKKMASISKGLTKLIAAELDAAEERMSSELVTGGRDSSWGKPLVPTNQVHVGITVKPTMNEKCVNTDPIPPVETYKERYEDALRQKSDVQSKLERSEDQRFKMARDNKRELEKVQKQAKAEAKDVSMYVCIEYVT